MKVLKEFKWKKMYMGQKLPKNNILKATYSENMFNLLIIEVLIHNENHHYT